MQETLTSPNRPDSSPVWNWRMLAMISVALLAVAAGFVWWNARSAQPQLQSNGFPLNPQIEERFGVRFTFLAVTGSGGLVDLRYRVVDEGKAANFGHYTETSPLIINETTGERLEVTKMGLHNHRVEPGRMYYIMYRNTGDAIHAGDLITIQIDDLTIEHIVAQ